MATIRDVVDAMRLLNGETEAVSVLEGVAGLYDAAVAQRDAALASEAAAKSALEAAKADAAAMAAKLALIFEDLRDGVYDGVVPAPAAPAAPAPAEPAPAE